MGSFAKLSVWPVGYFRATSSWLLRARKSVAARIAAINAEIARIGFIQVTYGTEEINGEKRPSETRIGFTVTKNSSLERLVRAYVAMGGNPLDISSFMHPDSTEIVEQDPDGNIKVVQRYPHGGVLAPKSAEYNEPLPKEGENTGYGADEGGWIRSDGYYPARQGGRINRGAFDFNTIVRYMHQIRAWANQDVKALQDLEWRIIKLCDLREQLMTERDEVLVQAFGGVLRGVGNLDADRFPQNLQVQNLIQDMYSMLYRMGEDGAVQGFRTNDKVPFLQFTFEDTASELRDPK